MGGVTTRDFGAREDAPIIDLELAGVGTQPDKHTAMGLFKGMVQLLGSLVDSQPQPAATLNTGQVILSTTPKEVLGAYIGRTFAEIKNTDAGINVYIGFGSGVSSVNGHLLKTGEAFDISNYSGPIWVVAASGTPTVTAIEW